MSKNIHLILHDKNILKGLILLSIPIFLNNVLKSLHDLVDAIFVARMDGYNQLELDSAISAINIYFPVNFLFLSIGIGLSVGAVAIVSQYIGAKRDDLAKKYASQLMLIGFIISLLIVGILIFISDVVFDHHLIALAMGARGVGLDFASKYFLIRGFDLLFIFPFLIYQSIRQAEGETLKPVLLNVIAIILNMIFTGLFIVVFKMGVVGAAYATVLANALITPFIFIDLFYSKKHLRISVKEMKLDHQTVEDVIKFALPASFGQGMTALGFIIIQSLVLSYGVEVSTGFGIGSRLTTILLYPVIALSNVNASYIGMNIGHHNIERAKRSYILTRYLSLLIMVIGVLIMLPFRYDVVAFILGNNTSRSYEIGVEFAFWFLLTQPVMAIFQTFIGLYNGAGLSKYTMFLSLLRLWFFRIPLVLILMLVFEEGNYASIFYALMISNIMVLPFGFYFESKIRYEMQVTLHA
ncbi:MAG: MATE family efflux transporter [Firmicutes bacterium]|nr:MATE family efflux transporter [Bacillota bacterium]